MPEPVGYRGLLALPVPRRLALASAPADLADWLDYAAIIALLVYGWGEGPFVLAFFALVLALPYVLVGPILAVLVDRVPLRLTLVLSNLGRAITTLLLVFAPDAISVLVLVFLRASIDSAFSPARQAAIRASTPEALLGSANGLHHALNQTSKIAGPALGGVLLAVVSPHIVFVLNSGLSVIAALLLVNLQLPPRPAKSTVAALPFWTELTAGIAEFRRNGLMLTALIFSAVAYFAFFLYDALIALLTAGFGLDASAFGFGIAASGPGGLIAALLAGRLPAEKSLIAMIGAAALSGITTISIASASVAGLPVAAPVFYLVMSLMGGSTAFMLVPYRGIIQRGTAPDRIGRVHAAGEAVIMCTMLSAPFVGSLIAHFWGTGMAFMCGGVLLVTLALVALLLTRGRGVA